MAKKKTKRKVEKRIEKKVEQCCGSWKCRSAGSAGCVYFLGFIGAAVYYISQATGFWGGVLGFIKALVWPAFLVFELLTFLGM